MANILFFKEIDKTSRPLAGGKGANLGEMTQAGFPIPDGFCVTTQVYKDFVRLNNLADLLNSQSSGEIIREKMQGGIMPDYFTAELEIALNHFAPGTYFSVRSSATAEDLEFASFAGQQDTYLNVIGTQNIKDAVRNCFASLFTDRAMLYRQQNAIDSSEVTMAVVIQKMVSSQMSGIMFTADPLTQSRDIISVDAGFGLGEALVSGLVSPDTYKYKKSAKKIIEKTIADKRLAILPLAGGGTNTVELNDEQAKFQVLTDQQILALAEIGLTIEKHYGFPQDIEWCVEENVIYIIQARNITSLLPLAEPQPKDNTLHLYFSFGHVQMMIDLMSPLGMDLIKMVIRPCQVPLEQYHAELIKSTTGRLYFDLSFMMQFKLFRKIIVSLLSNVDFLMASGIKQLVDREGFERLSYRNSEYKKLLLSIIRKVFPKLATIIRNGDTSDNLAKADYFIANFIKTRSAAIEKAAAGQEKLRAIYENVPLLPTMLEKYIYLLFPGLLAMKRLEKIENKYLGKVYYTGDLNKGLHGNVATEMGLALGDLADLARENPKLLKELENSDRATLVRRLEEVNKGFARQWEDFIDQYGCRASGEIDIANLRWAEDPSPVITSITSMIKTMLPGQHRKEFAEAAILSECKKEELIEAIEKKAGSRKAKQTRRLAATFRNCMPLREHHKYALIRVFQVAKQALLEEGQTLAKLGLLDKAEDVMYLEFTQLYRAIGERLDMRDTVAKRKEEYRRFSQITPPRLLTSDGECVKCTYTNEDAPGNAMIGMGVSPGVVEGIAKVVLDPTNESINKGELLVASCTDPGWTILFVNAAGLVTEIGGQLTHGSLVAREYGIPAVVGVDNATQLIKTGQRIRIDGDNSFVEILEN